MPIGQFRMGSNRRWLIQQPFASQSKVSRPLPAIQTVVSNTSFVEAMNFGLLTSPWNPASLNGLDCFSR